MTTLGSSVQPVGNLLHTHDLYDHLRAVPPAIAPPRRPSQFLFTENCWKRYDDSQRSDGLPETFAHPGHPHESLTARRAYSKLASSQVRRMRLERHDDSQRSGRLAVTQPVHPTPPPPTFSNRETTNRSG